MAGTTIVKAPGRGGVSIRFLGFDKLRKRFRRAPDVITRNVSITLTEAGKEIKRRSEALVPEKRLRLLRSAKLTRRDSKDRVTRIVSYDTPYAIRMHEGIYQLGFRTNLKATTQDGPAGRKYLSRPFFAVADKLRATGYRNAILKSFTAKVDRGV